MATTTNTNAPAISAALTRAGLRPVAADHALGTRDGLYVRRTTQAGIVRVSACVADSNRQQRELLLAAFDALMAAGYTAVDSDDDGRWFTVRKAAK